MEDFPPGFRFYPTEEELVSFYLHHKLEGKRQKLNRVIPVVDIYELEPWQLPKVSGELCHRDTEQWFFFVPRQEREARGGRPNRTTASGYWKATGSPSYVYSSKSKVIGVKRTMVFYKGKAPSGKKTKWKMNEYRAIEEEEVAIPSTTCVVPNLRHELSLCRVYVISGSFRAFDRRPLGTAKMETVTQQASGNGIATSSHNMTMMDETSSSESLYSENKEHIDHMENVDNPSWEIGSGGDFSWDLEQLNWL